MTFSKPFVLGDREFGYLNPYLISEIGVNYEGSLERAKSMIEGVAKAGGHAAKFQTYKADKLAAKETSPAYWNRDHEPTPSQHALFQRFDAFGEEEYKILADHCRTCGIDFMSTPFDLEAVDMLAPLVPAFKIASADLTNIPLLRKIAGKGLPVIMSVGASRPDEVATSLAVLRAAGATSITLLHCVLNYPTPPEEAQLSQIPVIMKLFGDQCPIGYSDHVVPDADGRMPALDIAAIFGSVVIEKHFTDNKLGKGNDHYHAMNSEDLGNFVQHLKHLSQLYGGRQLDLSGQKQAIDNARRRIIAAREINPGETITAEDLIALRSNKGIEIAHWDRVVGQSASRKVADGMPLEWIDLG